MNNRNNSNDNVPRSLLTPFARVCRTVADAVLGVFNGVALGIAHFAAAVLAVVVALAFAGFTLVALAFGLVVSEWKFFAFMACVYFLGGRNHPQFFYGFLVGYVLVAKALSAKVERTSRGTTKVTFR